MSLILPFKRPPQPARRAPEPRPLFDRFFKAWFERAVRRWNDADRYARYY